PAADHHAPAAAGDHHRRRVRKCVTAGNSATGRTIDIFSYMIHGKLTGGRVRAARCEEYGCPGNVVVRDIPDPVVSPGHVVVDVAAAGVNFPDLLFIANRYQVPAPLPFTPGREDRKSTR